MKRFITIGTLIISAIIAFGQQSPLYTQYMFNPVMINPAITGTFTSFHIRFISRTQWMGMNDAPITNVFSYFGPMSNKGKFKNMGYGINLYSDMVGPISQTNLSGMYAYNMAINEELRLSYGISGGLLQYKIDGSKLITEGVSEYDPSDNYLQGNVETKYLPDATVGILLYCTQYQIGFSADRLFNNSFTVYNGKTALSRLRSHFYLFGTYRYPINRKWEFEPNVILKGVYPAPPQLDINVKMTYNKMIWGGLSLRTSDAISAMFGYIYNKRVYLGIAYDYGLFTDISPYNFGSFEALVGIKFNQIK